MLQEGPDEISVSLDSHRSELHDRLRGVRGSFMSAVKALKLLIEARTRVKIRHGRIHAMLLVTSDNYTELDPAYDFVLNELRADKLKLNFLQPTIGYMGNIDYFFKHHSRMNPDKLEKHLQLCNAKYGLKMNPSWIALTRMYAASICDIPQNQLNWVSGPQTREPICNSYERNITVNLEGVARLCFSEYYPGTRLERPGDLTKFWESSGPLRTIMTGCRYLCGISHSVRKESCTIQETNT
jgi:MoaA/NifB/PqqE/SkfB family radical SAM enzyme